MPDSFNARTASPREVFATAQTIASVLLRRAAGKHVVLFHRAAGIGDIVCTQPAIREFRERHPETHIAYATRKEFIPVVQMFGCVDSVIATDVRGATWPMAPRLYDSRFDLLLADERMPAQYSRSHLVDQFAEQVGMIPADRQPRLAIAHHAAPRAMQAVAAIRVQGRPLIAIHIGPSWPVREWGKGCWAELADRLRARFGAVVVQLGVDANTGTGPCVAPRITGTADWVGKWSLAESVAAIAQMDLLIGIDSGLLHISGAVGTPCIGLFGAVDGRLRLPPKTPSRAVTGNVPCLGCHHTVPPGHWRTGCPHDIACMKAIAPGEVLAAVEHLLPDHLSCGVRTADLS